jgi:hypothetical protein
VHIATLQTSLQKLTKSHQSEQAFVSLAAAWFNGAGQAWAAEYPTSYHEE